MEVEVICQNCTDPLQDLSYYSELIISVLYIPMGKQYSISRTLYLAVCSENAVGGIINWRISLLYGEKPMLVV